MAATISDGTTSVYPVQILGYESTRKVQNRVHDLLNGDDAITLLPNKLRSGRLELLFNNLADAQACFALHSSAVRLTLTEDETPAVSMQYVANDEIQIRVDPATQSAWIVRAGYREVTSS